MREYVTKAIVLDKEDSGEQDALVVLYSPDRGKITAKVKSLKKITSKLNSHLEPFNLVEARLIDRGPQIVDALLIEKLKPSWALARFFSFLKKITYEGYADEHFWDLVKQSLVSGRFDCRRLLAAQGFDPRFAVCYTCQRRQPNHFLFSTMDFSCNRCLPMGADAADITLSAERD